MAPPATFPVVGIGASAGGLEALEAFFASVPADVGMAFVVVQHRSPDHDGSIAELLAHRCPLPVGMIIDGQVIEAGHVYVMPHDHDVVIRGRSLYLVPPLAVRGMRLPVDEFFRSLAEDCQQDAVGVVLSGMGSDGTLGLRAIRERAGATFAQTPDTAKFDGMPQYAVDAGVVDLCEAPTHLFASIAEFLRHRPDPSERAMGTLAESMHDKLDKALRVLRSHTGHDFSQYKATTIARRIARRMALHHLDDIDDYVQYLLEQPMEIDRLFSELLIGVTSFFRDPAMWEQLRSEVLPLLRTHPPERPIRAWVTGCSSGEEAYTMAMVITEVLDAMALAARPAVQIFATDLDAKAIQRARRATYPPNIAADVSEARLRRFFVNDERGYRVAKPIRDLVVFATQNVLADPPFTKLDLLSCRNLLIYLNPAAQQRLLSLFHYSLNANGTLVLGSAESIGATTSLFAPFSGSTRLYRRLQSALPADHLPIPVTTPAASPQRPAGPVEVPVAPVSTSQGVVDRLLLSRYAPTAVLVGTEGDIQYVSGRTGRYLEPAVGRANWNLLAMAREGLRTPLTEGLRRAARQQTPVTLSNLQVTGDVGTTSVDVVVEPLTAAVGLEGMLLVLFREPERLPADASGDGRRPTAADEDRINGLAEELKHTLDELRSARESMQLSQEELKSSNEELQSTNEELQSTNEELTTSKEEVQSMNDELQRVNHELLAKIDQLSLAGSDMTNLLNSTNIATLFLDKGLLVRRFTTPMGGIIKLRDGDVGRPVTEIAATVSLADLAKDAEEVLRTLAAAEREIAASDGRWFTVRVMPYRTHDDRIDGVVLTFSDITKAKQLEDQLRQVQGGTA
ncbi:MAG: chemotaxis protein CheB [Gemmatimonadota bacterium]|nr:chemotaxis protein CheB [Gemmatimonadota bacterium]